MSVCDLPLAFGLVCLAFVLAEMPANAAVPVPDAARVQEIAAMLGDQPAGLGQPATDRAAWDKLRATGVFDRYLPDAEKLLGEPLAPQPDDLYLQFSQNGNRSNWQRVEGRRRGRVDTFTMAEALEHKGRFIKPLEEVVRALCAEPTWVMPAHDGKLTNFKGESIDIDLGSSMLGWNLATCDWLLGDQLSPAVRQLLRDNLQRRIFDPFRAMALGERGANWWLSTTNNWNAVCLGGVIGAALEQLESREDRAFFVAAAEEYSKSFLRGFTPDGYCSEGVGYWDYGFGYYLLLSETVYQATDGGVDLLLRPEARQPGLYGTRIGIVNGVCPAFADCGVTSRPNQRMTDFVLRRLALGPGALVDEPLSSGSLYEQMLYSFPNSAAESPVPSKEGVGWEIRTWFNDAGILICRPHEPSFDAFGVALKGGHNAEHHNHNDVGSYVVVVGNQPVLLDPGSETYTKRTFSSHRYDSNVLNSSGHDVPKVAGQLQRSGREAQATLVREDFTEATDTIEFDLTAAYQVDALDSLHRTFVYDRQAPALSVTDSVAFKSPQAFETALLTLGEYRVEPDGSLTIWDIDRAVSVSIDTGGLAYHLSDERIHEDVHTHALPLRIGIVLDEPATTATITVKIKPNTQLGGTGMVKNGDFEFGGFGWSLGQGTLGEVSTEQAHSGQASLKITDPDKSHGSNINSAMIPADSETAYKFNAWVYTESGSGIGIYVKYYDAERHLLNETNAQGWLDGIGDAKGPTGEWAEFSLPFKTPPATTQIQLWIHSFNGAVVTAYLDDITIAKAE